MATRTAPPSRAVDAARGLASLLGLIALVVVVPVLLVRFIGWPLPRSMPSLDEITTALGDRYVPDRFLVGALAVVCWLIWAELVASVVVEAIALARGRTAAPVPLARGVQVAAGRLVAGVALLAALFAARGETPDAIRPLVPAPPVAASADATFADLDAGDDATDDEADAAPAAAPTYTVQPRDTLWDIAERCLGDPFRWNEIWTLNQHRTMDDGRTFTDPDRIHPGWVLTMPGDAVVGAPATVAGQTVSMDERTDGPDADTAPADASAERVETLDPVDGGGPDRVEVMTPLGGGPSSLPAADAGGGR